MTDPRPLELWFEFASTYTYLAVEAAAELTIRIAYRPFLLGPIFAAQGWNDSPFNLFPAKGRYMFRDVERLCEAAGVPWQMPTQMPRNSLLAARIAIAHENAPWLPKFIRSVFRANFAENREISEPTVLKELLSAQNLNPEAILESAQTPTNKQLLKDRNQQAIEQGIFGSPTWIAHNELFWGADRRTQAIAWWQTQKPTCS
ncbi:MAG: hypothetical protein RL701_457 [Pseudomonadota bacterium]|jgi:2-hydroxychromene-2-carboxylate isomerase